MRDIEFRAWHGTAPQMIYSPPLETKNGQVFCFAYDDDLNQIVLPLMQFTGLLDKNGTKIFEKDVVYIAGYGNYVCEFPFLELYEAAAENDIGEILGNIFENPELLNEN